MTVSAAVGFQAHCQAADVELSGHMDSMEILILKELYVRQRGDQVSVGINLLPVEKIWEAEWHCLWILHKGL